MCSAWSTLCGGCQTQTVLLLRWPLVVAESHTPGTSKGAPCRRKFTSFHEFWRWMICAYIYILETFMLSSRSSILLQSSTHRSLEKQAEHGEAACQPRSRHWEEGQGEGAVPPLFLSSPCIRPAHLYIFFSFQIHESSPLDLASEESERLPCLLTLLDMGAYVNAGDKHSEFFLLWSISPFWCSFVDFEISSLKEKRLCSMPWPAVTGSLCTTRRTSSCCCREVLTVNTLHTEVQTV